MDLDTKIIAVFCRIDDTLKTLFQGRRLRKSGPEPGLSDAEVLTIEAVGEFLGLSRDSALYRYFRQHYSHFFPAMAQVCRTTFVRQAANLWRVNELVSHPRVGSKFGLPHLGDDVPGRNSSVALLHFGPLLNKHADGRVRQPGDFLSGRLHGV